MNNGLLYLGGLLVVVLSALFAVPNLVDWNGYRGVFEEEASKVLGRDVRVGGSVNLKLFPVPYMRFEKVRISNLTGQTGEAFVRADSFTMWLSAPALLRGVIEASEIELNKPMITLAVDADGGGNWSSISLKPGDLPFVPRDVALRSVKLRDGAIAVYNAANERIAAIENIDGEFSADGLRGPFRYKGAATWSGTVHDVKLATETVDADGNFGLKFAARDAASPTVLTLDGQISNLSVKPKFTGTWTGKLAVLTGEPDAADKSAAPPLVDVKSTVTADALGAKFDDLVLTLDTAAVQMVSGTATASWTAVPKLDISLSSKWLDIDWLAGSGQGSASLAKVKDLAYGLMKSVAADGAAAARINLEQVKVGGETAGGLSIDAERRGTTTHFKTFKVSLPGASRLDVVGDLKADAGKMSFSGNVFVAGSNLARLKAWAGKSGIPIDIKSDGAFSAGGKLDMDDTRLAFADASVEFDGRPLAGDFTWTHDGRDRTEITLQAPDIDTAEIFPAASRELKATLWKAFGFEPPVSDTTAPATLPGDMRLRIIAGRWRNEGQTYRDVDVTFERDGGEIRLPAAKLTTPAGLTVGVEGRVKTNSGSPSGTLAYDLVGSTPDAIKDITHFSGLSDVLGESRIQGLRNGKIAGLLRFGLRTPAAADLTFDGTLNGLTVTGSAEFDGGMGAWRSKPSRVQATFEAPSLPALLATFGSGMADDNRDTGGKAQAFIATAGTIGDGVLARAEVTSPGMAISYVGRMSSPSEAVVALDGSVDIKTKDVAAVLALAGLPLPKGASSFAASGSFDVVRKEGAWDVAMRDLSLGGSSVSGALKIATAAGGGERIDGKLSTDRLNVSGLLSALTDKPMADVPAAVATTAGLAPPTATTGSVAPGTSPAPPPAAPDAKPVWPDGVFNFAALKNTQGTVDVEFRSLVLSGGLATHEGAMAITMSPGKLEFANLQADAAGGKLAGTLSLEQGTGGVALGAKLSLKDAQLAAMSPAGKGTATFEIEANGQAQSPAGLIGVLAGNGTIKTANAVLPGPGAAATSDIVDLVLRGKLQDDPRTMSAALLTALETSTLLVGDRDIAIKINDGSLKLESVSVDTSDGKVEGALGVDLTSLALSTSAQVTAQVKPLPPPPIPLPNYQPPAEKPLLPPILVLYSGQLDALAGVKPTVEIGDMQRELAVRQAERNVEQLKLARSIDEERFRLEKERRKKAEDDRLAAIAAARAKWLAEHAPPTAPPPVAPTVTAPAAAAEAAQQPDVPAAAGENAATASQSEAPAAAAVQPGSAPNPADPNTASTTSAPTITVEPIAPPAGATPPGDPAAAAPVIDPVTGLPIPPKTDAQKTSTPRPRTERSRTSSDEVRKSLGGFP